MKNWSAVTNSQTNTAVERRERSEPRQAPTRHVPVGSVYSTARGGTGRAGGGRAGQARYSLWQAGEGESSAEERYDQHGVRLGKQLFQC